MSLREKYLKILSRIIPVGAVGASLLLGSTVPSAANEQLTASQAALDQIRVSERLAAIREAVSAVSQSESGARRSDGNLQLAWGNRWNNWGWGGRRWSRGRPWNN